MSDHSIPNKKDDLYINGNWISGNGKKLKTRNPHNNKILEKYNKATKEQVKKAINSAEESFQDWKSLTMFERAEYLWELNDTLKNKVEDYGELVTLECGKEITEGKADINEAQHMVELAASLPRHPTGSILPSEVQNKECQIRRKPKGVIGSITPWNFPIAIPIWHIAIPLVYGNCIVFKPSEYTPKCGEVLARAIDDTDIPDGVFNFVIGGAEQGNEIVENRKTDCIQFTGSSEVGWQIQEKASKKKSTLAACEMGGKNTVIVTDEADLNMGVKCAVISSFKTTGQRCVSSENIIVHSDIYDKFKEKFINATKNIKIGNPLEEDTFAGPLINKKQVNKFEKYVKKASNDDDVNVLHKSTTNGNYVEPFVFETEWSDKEILKEEVFGPFVALIKYDGCVENAINIANDTEYGLAGSIVSNSRKQTNKYINNIELGLAYSNLACIGAEVHLPFGGVKKSGNGFPSGRGVIDICTEKVAWNINNDDKIGLTQGLEVDL